MAIFKPVVNQPNPISRAPHPIIPVPRPAPRPAPKPAPKPKPKPAPRPTPKPPPTQLQPTDPSFLKWFTSIYEKFLGRAPEPAAIQDAERAFQFFTQKGGDANAPGLNLGPGLGGIGPGQGEAAGGEDQADIAYKIATSPEALKDNRFASGLNPTQALALLTGDYQSLLQRAPEQEAVEDAVVALSGGFETPDQLRQKILNSQEYLRLHPAGGATIPPPPPPPPPPSSVTMQPGLVRSATQSRFDPNFAQNLAVFGGGALNRPGAGDPTTPMVPGGQNVPGGNLTFDPFASNPWGNGGQTSGGGNAPVFGTPTSLLQSALSNSSALAPPGTSNPNNPPSTGVVDQTQQSSVPSSTFPSLVQIGAPTTGVQQSSPTSPAQSVVPQGATSPVSSPFKPGVPPVPGMNNIGMLQF